MTITMSAASMVPSLKNEPNLLEKAVCLLAHLKKELMNICDDEDSIFR